MLWGKRVIHLKFINWNEFNKRAKEYKVPVWFSFHNDFITNQNFFNFTNDERLCFVYLLCIASQSNDHGTFLIEEDHFCHHTKMTEKVLKSSIRKLMEKQILGYSGSSGDRDGIVSRQNLGLTVHNITEQKNTSTPPDGVDDGQIQSGDGGPGPKDLVELWNEVKHPNLAAVKDLTEKRRKRAAKILKKYPAIETWEEVFTKLNNSKFCTGQVKPFGDRTKPWKASFDWLLSEDSITKILEGAYDK